VDQDGVLEVPDPLTLITRAKNVVNWWTDPGTIVRRVVGSTDWGHAVYQKNAEFRDQLGQRVFGKNWEPVKEGYNDNREFIDALGTGLALAGAASAYAGATGGTGGGLGAAEGVATADNAASGAAARGAGGANAARKISPPDPFDVVVHDGPRPRIRSYGPFRLATTPGPSAGARWVNEYEGIVDATTGAVTKGNRIRGWNETVFPNGQPRFIRPDTQPGVPKNYYEFDQNGNYIGKRIK
jgi:hypothetical protein